jgi:hypothetical protein
MLVTAACASIRREDPDEAPPVGVGQLGHARRTGGRPADAEEVCRIALA